MASARSVPASDRRACAAEILDVVPSVMNAVRASMRRHIGESLSIPQFRCLGFVSRNPAGSVSEVAAFLGVTLPTASTMVDRLVRAGYVLTVTSDTDRRRSELRITPDGKALMERVRGAGRKDLAQTLADASEADIKRVMDGLAVLQAHFRRGADVG